MSDPSGRPLPPAAPPAGSLPRFARGGDRAHKDLERLVVRASARVILMVFAAFVLVLLAWRLRALILLVLVSVYLAALLNPFVRMLKRRGVGQNTATFIVYLTVLVAALAIGYLFVHPVVDAGTRFARELPTLVDQVQHGKGPVGRLVTHFHLASYISQHAPKLQSLISRLGKPALAVGKTVVSGVVGAVTVAFITFFLLLELPKVVNGVLAWMEPEKAGRVRRITDALQHQVTGFMLGNFSTSLIAGVVVYITLLVTGVPFASVLAIWVGLVDFLPLIGGLVAGVPVVFVAFLHSLAAGIVTLAVFLAYQQIENHVLNPLIISRTVRLNPLWVLLSVLIGAEVGDIVGSTFGAICGALMAVPVAGSLQVGARELLAESAEAGRQATPGDP